MLVDFSVKAYNQLGAIAAKFAGGAIVEWGMCIDLQDNGGVFRGVPIGCNRGKSDASFFFVRAISRFVLASWYQYDLTRKATQAQVRPVAKSPGWLKN